MKVISKVLVAFVMVLFLSIPASAQPLEIYGLGSFDGRYSPCDCPICEIGELCEICVCPDETGFTTNELNPFPGPSALYKIDVNTGQPYFIGETGFGGCRGLDIHPFTGELYAVCSNILVHGGPPGMNEILTTNQEGLGQVLVHLDQETGEGTEIGPLGDGIGYLKGVFVSDISFNSDGTLYAHLHANDIKEAAEPGVSTSNGAIDNMLGTIDLQTGKFSTIGPTNSDDFLSAIGFATNGDLIQCANLNDKFNGKVDLDTKFVNYFTNINELNIGTGNATFLRQVNYPIDVEGHLNVIQSKDVDDTTGTFYAFLSTEEIRKGLAEELETNNLIPSGSYLVRINQFSGDVEIIGFTSPPFEDFLAIATKRFVRNVPTMSEYGLMATAVLLLGAAAIYLRRRQARTEV